MDLEATAWELCSDCPSIKSSMDLFYLPGLHFFKFIYSHVHTLFGPSLPPPPSLSGRTCSALFSNFVEEKT
jgi:hypothetical protein